MHPGAYLLDLIDIALVGWIFYRLLLVFRQTRAIRVLMGLGLLVVIYAIAKGLEFEALLGLVDTMRGNRLEVAVVIFAVIFADEIKDAFSGMFWRFSDTGPRSRAEQMVDEVSRACASMAAKKIGALIAIARSNPLDHWILADSVPVDAPVTAQMLETIFSGKTPLHDGALIIRGGRIVAAKCQFPPSDDPKITKKAVGMRHRAAFGISEASDAVVIVVSEERGQVSIVHRGEYRSPVPQEELGEVLRQLLEIRREVHAWYHPRRVFAHGWMKALAAGLAIALWADQEPSVALRVRPVVFEQAAGEVRRFDVKQGISVVVGVTDPKGDPKGGILLEKVEAAGTGEAASYVQRLPEIRLEVKGSNFQRLRLLPRLARAWVSGRGVSPEELIGQVGVVLKKDLGVGAHTAPIELAGGPFWLADKDRSLSIVVDKLVPLVDAEAESRPITVECTGRPAEGYVLKGADADGRKKVPVVLAGIRSLLLPSGERDRIEREKALDPCPTDPAVSVQGRKAFNAEVTLLVPEALREWNPGQSFTAQVVVDVIWAEPAELSAEQKLLEDQREVLDAQRVEAGRRAAEARDRWAALEKRIADGSWEAGYRLAAWTTLTQQSIPDLESRAEKAAIEVETVGKKVERLQGDVARLQEEAGEERSKPLELARIRLTAALKEQALRREINEALGAQLVLLRKEAGAIRERIRPELEAIVRAERLREETTSAELQLPPVEADTDLKGLIDPDGPAGAARTEGAAAIVAAAGSRAALQLHARAVTTFERWADAAREAKTLEVELKALRDQLEGRLPPTASPVRLELIEREKKILLEVRGLIATRQATFWRDLRPRLVQGGETFGEETRLLQRIALAWPLAQVQRLGLTPLLDLFREVQGEVAPSLAAQRFFDELAARNGAAAAANGSVGTEPSEPAKAGELSKEAREAGVIWSKHQEAMRRRMAVLVRIARRVVLGDIAPPTRFDVDEAEAELAAIAERVAAADARLAAHRLPPTDPGHRPVRLDDLQALERERAPVVAEIEQRALPHRDDRRARLEAIEARLGAARADGTLSPEERGLAFESCRLRTSRYYAEERLRRLQAHRERLDALIALVKPEVERLLATFATRKAELDQLAASPQQERVAALAYLAEHAERASRLEALEAELAGDGPIGGAIEGETGERLAVAFEPVPSDDVGFDRLAALRARIEHVKGLVAAASRPGEEETVDPAAGRTAAMAEMRRRLREYELGVRTQRLEDLRHTEEALTRGLLETDRIVAIADRLRARLTPEAAASLPLGRLNDVVSRLRETIEARERQRADTLAQVDARTDAKEKDELGRRAEVLAERIAALKKSLAALERLVEAVEGLAG